MVGWALVWDVQELASWHDDGLFVGELDRPEQPLERDQTLGSLRIAT